MTSAQRQPAVLPGRPAVADLVATLLVATAVVLAILWLTDLALTDWSTRVVAGVVLALGYVGCMTTQTRMAEVYGPQGRPHAPLAYVVAASSAGAIALISGVVAVIWAAETMLVVLVAACVVLWAMATARHLVMRDEPRLRGVVNPGRLRGPSSGRTNDDAPRPRPVSPHGPSTAESHSAEAPLLALFGSSAGLGRRAPGSAVSGSDHDPLPPRWLGTAPVCGVPGLDA